jgi:hypothetical protein
MKLTLESLNPFDTLTALSTAEGPRILDHFLSTREELNMNDKQERLLRDIVFNAEKVRDRPVKDIFTGDYLISITSAHTGLCTRVTRNGGESRGKSLLSGKSAMEIAIILTDPLPELPDAVSFAMAAINSLLPVPEDALQLRAQEIILERGKGKNVAVIGHFPFVDRVGSEFRNLWVLENRPIPGDLPAEAAGELLPQADVVAMTATTLLNGTCADLLGYIPKKSFTIMLGPSTPFAPCLFDWGIDALAGSRVKDNALVTLSMMEGLPRRQLKGIDPLVWIAERDN